MPAAINTSYEEIGNEGSTVRDFAVTVGAGEGLVALLAVSYSWGNTATVTSVVWDPDGDNQAFMQIANHQPIGERRVYGYKLQSPTTAKTGIVRVTVSGTNISSVGMLHGRVSGHSSTFVRDVQSISGSLGTGSPSISQAVASVAGDLVVDFISARTNWEEAGANTGQTEITKWGNGSALRAASRKTATGTSTTMQWNTGNQYGPYDAVLMALSIAPQPSSNVAPTFPGPNLSNISATQGVAIAPVATASSFADAGDTLTYSASPSGTAWPAGLTINSTTGQITGTMSTVATTTGIRVRATDVEGLTVDSNAFNVTVSAPNAVPTFPGPNLGNITATQNVAITPISTAGSFADAGDTLTYSASPAGTAWPAGLSINSSTGSITGALTTVATTNGLRVRATDSAGQTVDSNTFNVVVSASAVPVAFSGTITAPGAAANQAYSLSTASYFSGTQTPFTYSLFAGTLPTGLTLNTSTGVISGTPTAGGTASGLVVRATDSSNNTANSNAFSITVTAATAATTTGMVQEGGGLFLNAAAKWHWMPGTWVPGDAIPAGAQRGTGTTHATTGQLSTGAVLATGGAGTLWVTIGTNIYFEPVTAV